MFGHALYELACLLSTRAEWASAKELAVQAADNGIHGFGVGAPMFDSGVATRDFSALTKALREHVEEDPLDFDRVLALMLAHALSGDQAAADQVLSRFKGATAKSFDPPYDTLNSKAMHASLLYARGQPEGIGDIYKGRLRGALGKDSVEWKFISAVESEELRRADALLRNSKELRSHELYLLALSVALRDAGNRDRAEELFQRAVADLEQGSSEDAFIAEMLRSETLALSTVLNFDRPTMQALPKPAPKLIRQAMPSQKRALIIPIPGLCRFR